MSSLNRLPFAIVTTVLPLFLMLVTLRAADYQPTSVPRDTWTAFIAWARTQAFEQIRPGQVLQNYRAHLEAQQPRPANIEATLEGIGLVLKDFFRRATPEQREWDLLSSGRFYASRPSTHVFPFPPNDFVARMMKDLPRGKSLDGGMGAGRDAIWLAQQGWDASGFELIPEAVTLSLENAKAAGAKITATVSDAADFDWGIERYDLVTNIHSLPHQRFLSQIRRALKPGGIYITENAMLNSAEQRAMFPGVPAPNEPLTWFMEGWRILHYEDARAGFDCAGCRAGDRLRVYRIMVLRTDD